MQEPSSPRDPLASRIPFFYGWIMVPIAMLVQICTSPGQTYGISIFNRHLSDALSLSLSQLSGAYMLGTLLAALPMTYIGFLMDRYGPRRTLAGVVLLFGFTCLGMTRVNGLLSLFFAFLFLRMFGQGAMGLLANSSVALWFNRKLGMVSGIMSVGSVAAMTVYPTLSLWLIHRFDWRWSYAILGISVWILLLPLLILAFRDRPEEVGQRPDDRGEGGDPAAKGGSAETGDEPEFTLAEAMRTRAYWIVAGATAFWSMSVTGVHFHSVQIFLDRGLTEAAAAAMFTVFGPAMGIMRFIGGILADRLPLNGLLAAGMGLMTAGFLLLTRLSTPLSAHLFAGALGGAAGVQMAVNSTLWVRYYGRAHLGKIVGSLTTIGVGASSLGPFIMGATHDLFGRFDASLWLFVVLCAPLTVAALMATPPRNRGQGPPTASPQR